MLMRSMEFGMIRSQRDPGRSITNGIKAAEVAATERFLAARAEKFANCNSGILELQPCLDGIGIAHSWTYQHRPHAAT
mgnify:CR=1 FL=1